MLKNVLIVVEDMEKSIEFYRDLFGLQLITIVSYNYYITKLKTYILEARNEQRFIKRTCCKIDAFICNSHDIGGSASTVL